MPNDQLDYIPKEEETIVAKRSARIADKELENLRNLQKKKTFLSNFVWELFAICVILFLNLSTVWQFLGTSASPTRFSGPVIPLVTKAFGLFGFEFGYGLQMTNILFFLAFGMICYVVVKNITGRKMAAVLTTLVASMPVAVFAQKRIELAFVGTDAPHVSSLTLILIVLSTMLHFVRHGGVWWMVGNVLLITLVGLVSPSGLLALMLFLGITVFSEMLLGNGRIKLIRMFVVLLLSAGLSCFWYSPGFLYWLVMGEEGRGLRLLVGRMVPVSMFAIPMLTVFGYLLFDRKPGLQPVFLAMFYTICFGFVSVASGGIDYSRFVSEFGFSLAFLIGLTLVKTFEFVRDRAQVGWLRIVSWGALTMLVAGMVGTIGLLRDRVYAEDTSRVLGLWTDVQKDQIWEKRDQFLNSPLSYMGTVISAMTVFAMVAMVVRSSDWRRV